LKTLKSGKPKLPMMERFDSRTKQKNDFIVVHKTLYFRNSGYSHLNKLDEICNRDYSYLLLVLAFLLPEYFVEFNTIFGSKLNEIKHADLVILREEIDNWSRKEKIKKLMKVYLRI
jgi:hypothetical protein